MKRLLFSLLSNIQQEPSRDIESARLLQTEDVIKYSHASIPVDTLNTNNEITTPKTIVYYWREGLAQKEIVAIIRYCIPLVITFLLGYGKSVVDVWFLGRTNSETMAAVSLANLFATTTGISIGTGMLTAIETLAAQAFTGTKNTKTIGIIVQRAFFVASLFGVFVSLLWTFAESILVAFGQSPELAHMAQQYLSRVTPYIFICFTVVTLRKFLQSIGEMKVTMYVLMALTPLNMLSNYFYLIHENWGYIGAAYHTDTIQSILLIIYILFILVFTDAKKYWPGFSRQAFKNWGEFLKLGIPGMLSVSTDWAFEVCAIVAGVLGKTSLAAQAVVLTCNTWLLMIPNALGTSVVVRLGHHLGANRPEKSKLCFTVATLIGLMIVTIDTILLYTCRSLIAHHFSNDDEVRQAIEELMGVGCLAHFALGFGIVLSGTLNAFGKQPLVALINITSYYVIGLPIGLVLTYHYNWGLIGVWSGVVISGVLKFFAEATYIFFIIDWQTECLYAAKRIKYQEQQ